MGTYPGSSGPRGPPSRTTSVRRGDRLLCSFFQRMACTRAKYLEYDDGVCTKVCGEYSEARTTGGRDLQSYERGLHVNALFLRLKSAFARNGLGVIIPEKGGRLLSWISRNVEFYICPLFARGGVISSRNCVSLQNASSNFRYSHSQVSS